MRLVALAIVLAVASVNLALADDSELTASSLAVPTAPVKLDKNLRQALLRALEDLEAESAEQRKDNVEPTTGENAANNSEDIAKKDLNKNLGIIPKTSFAFSDFANEEEIISEDKLQNSSFIDVKKLSSLNSPPAMIIEKASKDDTRSFHVQNVILPEKNKKDKQNIAAEAEHLEAKNVRIPLSPTFVNKVESITQKPLTQISESLVGSSSSGIASANSLIVPKPTVSSPTVAPQAVNNSSTPSTGTKERSEEVKIFQAPLVAAFTVQQDERGVPKSVVPIYRPSGDGQALTLQEQLEFKQKLLEKQLDELQQQQIQQTQYLVRQQQLYEQQLRQKQQHQIYLQEQARIKILQEQHRLKQIEEQRLYRLREQQLFQRQQQQKQGLFDQSNNILPLQVPHESQNVRFQPSISLELPNAATLTPFHSNFQDQQRVQQQNQQRLQQSFATDFQPSVTTATRFHRQEALNAVGNFGLNFDNKPTATRNSFGFDLPVRNAQSFNYNPYTQFRQPQSTFQSGLTQQSLPQQNFPQQSFTHQSLPNAQFRRQPDLPQQNLNGQYRQPTPAKQIQNLLYQSGIAGDIGTAQGTGAQEDLNILSKVLALNVGALPNQGNFANTANHP